MSINSLKLQKSTAATGSAAELSTTRDTGAAVDAPPRLTGGDENTPLSSKGTDEKLFSLFAAEEIKKYEYFKTTVTDDKGRLIEIPLRRGLSDAALIDQLTFTIHETTLTKYLGYPLISDTDFICAYSEILMSILGFGVTERLPFKGKFFYDSCYHLGPSGIEYGKLHYGGQRDTILIELNGTGCQAAKEGWESRLYAFLKLAIRPNITRVDVAHDFFNGEYSPERAMVDHDHGLFDCKNMRPKSECVGAAWREEDFTGKTFYVGRRGNAKFTRIYEKGRAFGDKDSKWVRFETEFRATKTHHVPLAILQKPGEFLTGAYPVGASIFDCAVQRIETKSQTVNLTFDQRIFHAKNQVGRLMNFLLDIGKAPDEICKMLKADDGKYPNGLMPEQYDADKAQEVYLHEYIAPLEDDFGMVNLPSLSPDFDHRRRFFLVDKTDFEVRQEMAEEAEEISRNLNNTIVKGF